MRKPASPRQKAASAALGYAGLAIILILGCCGGSTRSRPVGAVLPTYQDNCNAELGIRGRQGILLDKTYFVINYNPAWGSAYWVAECVTAADLKGKAKRKGIAFFADPELPESLAVTPKDYTGSGFDRGHLAPAGDMVRSKAAMKASFSMANMHPQYPDLNRQSWRLLEEAVRDSILAKGKGWVVTGQLIGQFPKWIGKTHRVVVPDFSFKAVLLLDEDGNYSGFAALGHNVKEDAPTDFVPIDSIEALSGFDFFPLLEDVLENRIEAE